MGHTDGHTLCTFFLSRNVLRIGHLGSNLYYFLLSRRNFVLKVVLGVKELQYLFKRNTSWLLKWLEHRHHALCSNVLLIFQLQQHGRGISLNVSLSHPRKPYGMWAAMCHMATAEDTHTKITQGCSFRTGFAERQFASQLFNIPLRACLYARAEGLEKMH